MAVFRNVSWEERYKMEADERVKWKARADNAETWLTILAVVFFILAVIVVAVQIGRALTVTDCYAGGYSQLVIVHGIDSCARIEEGVPVLIPLATVRERLEE